MRDDARKLYQAGMDDYIFKPARLKQLAEKILKWEPLGRRIIETDEHRSSRKTNYIAANFRARL
jgi:CheY-like chemotaxis protein